MHQKAIDDTLPFDRNGNPVGISTSVKGVLWPALIEKGYMKLMGGYDFPGSNSAIDMHALTGWIPEFIDLQSTSFERERTWTRIMNGFRNGHCVLTVGTDSKTTRKIRGVHLLPSHNYAVISVREYLGERWITLLDSRIPVQGSPTHEDYLRNLDMRWDDLCATFEGVYVSWDPRLFHKELSFHGIWKPRNAEDKEQCGLSFAYEPTILDISLPNALLACIRHLRLQYSYSPATSLSSQQSDMHPVSDNDVWVLLVRHLPDTQRTEEYIAVTVNPEDEWMNARAPVSRFPSLSHGGSPTETEVKGTYTTSTHVLVRAKVRIDQVPSRSRSPTPSLLMPSPTLRPTTPTPAPSGPLLSPTANSSSTVSGALTILACYDGPFEDVYFTVSVFCGSGVGIKWDENAGVGGVGIKGHSVKLDGTFTTKNAGGNHTHPTYMVNPQWHLRILEQESIRRSVSPAIGTSLSSGIGVWHGPNTSRDKATVTLCARGPRDVPLNLTAVWSSGERIVELTQREVVANSGAYAYGYASAFASLPSGNYTVILSAFEPQTHFGPFTLKVESSRKFELTPIPQEGAGMYTRVTKGEWDARSAVGGPSHGRYHLNPIYELDVPSTTQFSARLHLVSGSQAASLNLSLFPFTEPMLFDHPLASSGPYSDAFAGVDIPKQILGAGKYWLVPSTWVAGVQAGFKLVVYCSDSGCVVSRKET